jgi:hypothetical protein
MVKRARAFSIIYFSGDPSRFELSLRYPGTDRLVQRQMRQEAGGFGRLFVLESDPNSFQIFA